MKPYNKSYNVLHSPSDIQQVSRVIQCGSEECERTIVEYGQHVAETRHARGITPEVLEIIIGLGKPVVEQECDHHGGVPYQRRPLNV